MIFLLKFVFVAFWHRDLILEVQFLAPLRVVLLCFATPSFQIALCWLHQGLLAPAAACATLMSFAAQSRESYWSGCVKVAIVICQQILSILALVMFWLDFLLKCSKSSLVRFGAETWFWSCNFRCHYVHDSFPVFRTKHARRGRAGAGACKFYIDKKRLV